MYMYMHLYVHVHVHVHTLCTCIINVVLLYMHGVETASYAGNCQIN